MAKDRAQTILQILLEISAVPTMAKQKNDPFETLIITIISQNTADINTERAFENLSKNFEITPQVLAEAKTTEIEACLHVAGLYKNKAKAIRTVSKIIVEKFDGSMKPILSKPFEEARKILTALPGVGPKTADVVLLFAANQQTIPIDTHVNRVSKRLSLAPLSGDYETVRLSLQSFFDPKDYQTVHLLFIAHGRKYCKAKNPHCQPCPVNNRCPSRILGAKHD